MVNATLIMKFKIKYYVIVLCVACVNSIVYSADSALLAQKTLLDIFPNSISVDKNNDSSVFSFCPDNTCIEIKQKKIEFLDEKSFVYLYYFGDYYELEKWRNNHDTPTQIEIIAKKIELEKCYKDKVADKKCLADELKHSGIRVYFTRFDEETKISNEIW